jgi:hypothetical protein
MRKQKNLSKLFLHSSPPNTAFSGSVPRQSLSGNRMACHLARVHPVLATLDGASGADPATTAGQAAGFSPTNWLFSWLWVLSALRASPRPSRWVELARPGRAERAGVETSRRYPAKLRRGIPAKLRRALWRQNLTYLSTNRPLTRVLEGMIRCTQSS